MRLVNLEHSTYLSGHITSNVGWEIGWQRMKSKGIDVFCDLRSRGDHAGFRFHLHLWGWLFEINITDNRHWHYKEERFYLPGEEERELATPLLEPGEEETK